MTTTALAPAPTPASTTPFSQEELEALYVKLERRVFNVVYRWLWNREDAADVVQEAFAKVWTMRLDLRRESVEALVYRIAVNLASNRRRARKVWSFVTLDALTTAPPEVDDTQRRVRAAVDALPERLRRVVVLGELAGMTAKEVGAVLGIPEGTVASRRHHALAALKTALGDMMEADRD